MLTLIRKDFLLHKNMLLIMLALLVVAIYYTTSTIWVGILFCIAIIMHFFSADEKSSTQLLLNSLPFTRKEIVSSKYISAVFFMLILLVTTFFAHLIIYKEVFPLSQLLFIACIVFVFISFAFPFSYQFNSQYLLIGSGVLFVLYLVTVNLFLPNLNDIAREITGTLLALENYQLYVLAGLGVLILFISSWLLSIRIYSRKVF